MICNWVVSGEVYPKLVAKWINVESLESNSKNKLYVTTYKNNLNTDHLKVYQSSADRETPHHWKCGKPNSSDQEKVCV